MEYKLDKFINKWVKVDRAGFTLVGYVEKAKTKEKQTELGIYTDIILEGTMYSLERGLFTISGFESMCIDPSDIKIISKEQAARFVNELLRRYSIEATGKVDLLPKLKQRITINRPTKLYCLVYGEVDLVRVTANEHFPIIVQDSKGELHSYTKYGYLKEDCGECVLFPDKKYRNWDSFKLFVNYRQLNLKDLFSLLI